MSSKGSGSRPHKHSGEYDGEPGCQTPDEIKRAFRHFWDPTTYWQCEESGQRAKRRRCPQSELYSDKAGKCVHYTEWQWSEPTEPPSRPKSAKS